MTTRQGTVRLSQSESAESAHSDPPNVQTGTKRDCQCLRAKHEHGTPDAYIRDRCRCEACTAAQKAKLRQYRRLVAYGRWGPQWVTPHGIVRRLQALECIGYNDRELARRLGVDPAWVQRTATERQIPERMSMRTYRKIDRLYQELSMRPVTDPALRPGGARSKAKRYGWAPPLAWDDDTIDDPEAKPAHTVEGEATVDWVVIARALDGEAMPMSRDESWAVGIALARRGATQTEIQNRLRTSGRRARAIKEAA